jgi:hypothetical protein
VIHVEAHDYTISASDYSTTRVKTGHWLAKETRERIASHENSEILINPHDFQASSACVTRVCDPTAIPGVGEFCDETIIISTWGRKVVPIGGIE